MPFDDVILCLDNDKAGIQATERLTGILQENGYSRISVERSTEKDWNDELAVGAKQPEVTLKMS